MNPIIYITGCSGKIVPFHNPLHIPITYCCTRPFKLSIQSQCKVATICRPFYEHNQEPSAGQKIRQNTENFFGKNTILTPCINADIRCNAYDTRFPKKTINNRSFSEFSGHLLIHLRLTNFNRRTTFLGTPCTSVCYQPFSRFLY